jgi:predicted SnoaL-like aldol condensation-catalyzing enzyme
MAAGPVVMSGTASAAPSDHMQMVKKVSDESQDSAVISNTTPSMPTGVDTVSGNLKVQATINLPQGQGVDSVTYQIVDQNGDTVDGENASGTLSNNGSGDVYTAPQAYDTTNLTNGATYAVQIKVHEKNPMNSTAMPTQDIPFKVKNGGGNGGGQQGDTTAPTIQIQQPTSYDHTNGAPAEDNSSDLTISGTATDDQTSVGKVNVKVTDLKTGETVFGPKNQVQVNDQNKWSTTVPANTLPSNGDLLQVNASGRDQANNIGKDHAYFTVNNNGGTNGGGQQDNMAPDVSITSPQDNASVSGTVPVKATIKDQNPDHYYLRITNAKNGDLVYKHIFQQSQSFKDNQIYSFDTNKVDNGKYNILVSARDANGNRDNGSQDQISVMVDNGGGNNGGQPGNGGDHNGNGNGNGQGHQGGSSMHHFFAHFFTQIRVRIQGFFSSFSWF